MRKGSKALVGLTLVYGMFGQSLLAEAYFHGDWLKIQQKGFPDLYWVQILDRTELEGEERRSGRTEIKNGSEVILQRRIDGQSIDDSAMQKFRAITASRGASGKSRSFQTYRQFSIEFNQGGASGFSLSTSLRNEKTWYVGAHSREEYRISTSDQFPLVSSKDERAEFIVKRHLSLKEFVERDLKDPVYMHSLYREYNYATAYNDKGGMKFARIKRAQGGDEEVYHVKNKRPDKFTFELSDNGRAVMIKNDRGEYLVVNETQDSLDDIEVTFSTDSKDKNRQWLVIPVNDEGVSRYRDLDQTLVHLRHRKTGRYLNDHVNSDDDGEILVGHASYHIAGVFALLTDEKPVAYVTPDSISKKNVEPFRNKAELLPVLMAASEPLYHGDFVIIRDSGPEETTWGNSGWTQIRLAKTKDEDSSGFQIKNGSQVMLSRNGEFFQAVEGYGRKAPKFTTYRSLTVNFEDQNKKVFTLSITKKNGKVFYVTAPREASTTLHDYSQFFINFSQNPYFDYVNKFSLSSNPEKALKFGIERRFSPREKLEELGDAAYIYSLDGNSPAVYLYQEGEQLKGIYASGAEPNSPKPQQFTIKKAQKDVGFEIQGNNGFVIGLQENRQPYLVERDSVKDKSQIRWTIIPTWQAESSITHQATGSVFHASSVVPYDQDRSRGTRTVLSREKMVAE